MQLRQATRQKAKIRLGLSAVSGGGKTFSAIKIAEGLCGDLSKVAIIDTENGSADLYAHLGPYQVLTLTAPFTPERYIEAIKTCETAGIEVIIIDSITHEWDGPGGILSISSAMSGNSYTNWAKLTPRHDAFINAILQSTSHIITTVRRKQDYEMSKGADGKTTVQKVGLKEVTRDGFEYEVTLNLELDTAHYAKASKDRTGLFIGKPEFVPSVDTGKLLREWCESGAEPLPVSDGRETLTVSHPNWSAVVDAVQNKNYSIETVEVKYKIEQSARVELEKIVATKIVPAAPVPVTQSQIQQNNANYISQPTTIPATNGKTPAAKPF